MTNLDRLRNLLATADEIVRLSRAAESELNDICDLHACSLTYQAEWLRRRAMQLLEDAEEREVKS